MKKILKIAVVAGALVLMVIPDVAYAQWGHGRRVRRRTAVVVGSTAHAAGAAEASGAQQQAAAAQQQSAASQQQAAAAEKEAAAAKQEAAAAEQQAAAYKQQLDVAQGVLPLGTVVPTLPSGCTTSAISGVEYYHCGANYYRAVFQGNTLVYVTSQPQ
jgi:hypothetical protein